MGDMINYTQFSFMDMIEAMQFDENGDGILENNKEKGLNELSLFDAECKKRYGKIKRPDEVSLFNTIETKLENLPCFREILELNAKPKEVEDTSNAYKKDKNYPSVLTVIKNRAKTNNPSLTEEEMENAAKMVIEKCQKYDIPELAPLIGYIVGIECSLIFEDKGMNSDPLYKGAMGVSYDACCSIIGQREPRKIKGEMRGAKSNETYSGERKRRLSQADIERIDEFKQKYPTPSKLFEGISKDAELGIEAGILAFKIKLSYAKGDVLAALHKYGGTYKKIHSLPNVKGLENVPKKIDMNKSNDTNKTNDVNKNDSTTSHTNDDIHKGIYNLQIDEGQEKATKKSREL